MVFSEIYGSYFNAVAEILTEALREPLPGSRICEIVREKAFGESVLAIPEALATGRWPLIDNAGNTPLKHAPSMPLTTVQKRWMKSILLDPRIALFHPEADGLENVEPLFVPEDLVYFDRYADGDPYEKAEYREHFHIVLTALKMKQKVMLNLISRRGTKAVVVCVPHRLEYSLKDDKFRLIGSAGNHLLTVNVARITSCQYAGGYREDEHRIRASEKEELELRLTDERNALERCMLHFSDFEKQTEKLDDIHYRVLLRYEMGDETEVLIRVLSFGPKLEVISPNEFREKIKERLLRQRSCGG